MDLKVKYLLGLLFAGAVFIATGIFIFEGKPLVEINFDRPNGEPPKTIVKKPEPLKILFGGDIFLDRSIRRTIEENSVDYPWANIETFLESYKYKVANLEGPVWNREKRAPNGSFSFAFQESYVQKLKDLGFTALSLANNHTLNEGTEGLSNSRAFLEKIGIAYFGDPLNAPEYSFWTTSLEGKKLAFVGEHDLVPNNQKAILAKVAELKTEGYFVVVYPHWGPEYKLDIPAIEQERAHVLVDAGADLIIGAHPHVVQPVEIYKDKVIFYSLGNFLFDQYFSYDTLHGLLVEAVFEDNGIKFILHPTAQDKVTFQVSLANAEERQKMLDRLAETSVVPARTKESILSGQLYTE